MSASRSDVLFPHRRCVPHYPLDDYQTIPKYYFKLFKVSFLITYNVRTVDNNTL